MAPKDDREFDFRIINCIDHVLSSFGETPRLLLYHMIVKECNLSKEQFSSKPAELATCLTNILGITGCRFIERMTIREIQTSFKISVKEDSTLAEAIEQARNSFVTC